MENLGPAVTKLLEELNPFAVFGQGAAEGHELAKNAVVLTNYSFFLIVAIVLTTVFFLVVARKMSLVPKGIGNIGEMGVEFVRNNIVVDVMGQEGLKYLPFIVTVFFAVLFNNFLGLIPGLKPGTGTLGTTFAWGILVFIIYNWIGFKKHGLVGYLKSFLPSGTPWWLVWLIYPLEVISHFLRPFTLGVRLYANMYAGHIVMGIFGIFVVVAFSALSPVSAVVGTLSLAMQIIMYAFEVFVAFIQAYVFAILTAVYMSGALHAGEH
ncbi:MAG TPA: F0F1 ATP synthase subunit A [Coriobacteriia bacterium]